MLASIGRAAPNHCLERRPRGCLIGWGQTMFGGALSANRGEETRFRGTLPVTKTSSPNV